MKLSVSSSIQVYHWFLCAMETKTEAMMMNDDDDCDDNDDGYEQVVCFLSPEPSLYGALMPRSTLGNNCALIHPI